MTTQATGVFKTLAYKKETSFGVVPTNTGWQYLRRVSSDVDLKKEIYGSNEIRTDQQKQDERHGVRRVEGTLSGELSPSTYADFLDAALRRDRTAGASATGLSVTIAGTGPTYTLTRAAGSWITDGFKRGDVGRLTAGSFTASNLNKNVVIVSLTATVATVMVLNGSGLVAEGPIASATFALTGKKSFAPTSGHTDESFSLEHWFSDIGQSEVFAGCQPSKVDIQMPPTGLSTISIGIMGQDLALTGLSQYASSPSAPTTTGLTASVNGVVVVNGTPIAMLTGLNFSINSNRSGNPVVGSNVIPRLFPGRILVDGQATAYFQDATFRDAFKNETEMELIVVLTSDNTNSANFVAFTMPRVKINGSSKSDGESGLVQTIPFSALLPTTGGSGVANEMTTISYQDSAAA